ncbi:MAG TPA: MerC domain-containing protein [Chitinophagaceae bacterium]|nr:MerC domain-containing protein [Chitinophagaceae bacterium]
MKIIFVCNGVSKMRIVHKRFSRSNIDFWGITISVACAIHCALLPLLFVSLPILGINIIDNTWFEYGMIILAFAVGVFALSHGYKKHHHKLIPVYLFSVGILLLTGKQVFEVYKYWFLFPAIGLIIYAHLLNYNLCRRTNHCHADDCNH